MPNTEAWKSHHPTRYHELLNMMKKWAVLHGDFTLTSGAKSTYLIDVKRVALSGKGHKLLGSTLLSVIDSMTQCRDISVAGVELGGCPLASAAAAAAVSGFVDAIYVRKAKKQHGSARLVEAPPEASMDHVFLLEDVITTGGSTLRAIESLRNEGFTVQGVIAVVDREEGGLQAVAAVVPKTMALFTARELLE